MFGMRVVRGRGTPVALCLVLFAASAATTAVTLAPAAPAVAADVIEVTATCSLADAIRLANTGTSSAGCAGYNAAAPTIRITTNSGTTIAPLTGVELPGVYLDPGVLEGTLIGGVQSILPTITANVTIEGDPTSPQPAFGYGIFPEPFPVSSCILDFSTVPPTEVCSAIPARAVGRILDVAPSGSLTLRNLSIGGGLVVANGAAGAAVLALGPLTLDGVTLLANKVVGDWGGDALGGAVYAASALTVRESVFDSNVARGGVGGGSALGGAIALSPGTNATISDSVFINNAAYGGTGNPGTDGDDGAPGVDGRDGICSTLNTSWATGVDGSPGKDGDDGTDGDDGGDAVGVIAGGFEINIDHSAFVDSTAVAGAAGAAGFGGKGGDGGDGGDGASCTVNKLTAPWDVWDGPAGDGGQGGNNGTSGVSGDRGTAVATFNGGPGSGGAPSFIRLLDVTIAGASATVPDDNFGSSTREEWNQRRDRVFQETGAGGAAGGGPTPGAPGFPGERDETLLDREALIGAGGAAGFGSSGVALDASYSTFANFALAVPEPANNPNGPTLAHLTLAASGLTGSLLWNPAIPTALCPSLQSLNYNMFGNGTGCQPVNGLQPNDMTEPSAPVSSSVAYVGVVLRPYVGNGSPYRMAVLPLRRGSAARNHSAQCRPIGSTLRLFDDARRTLRNDGSCDLGAYEYTNIDAAIELDGPPVLYRGATPPSLVTVSIPNNPGPLTSVVLRVEGIDGVQFPTGYQPTGADSQFWVSEAMHTLPSADIYPIEFTFPISADAATAGTVTVRAWIEGTVNPALAIPIDIDVRHDGELDVAVDAPDEWSPCSGYLPITYTATSIGHSPAPPAAIRVWPNLVRPTLANALQPPPGEAAVDPALVYPSAGTTATVDPDGSVLWNTPTLAPGDPPATLRVFVAVGWIDPTQAVYQPGFSVQATSYVSWLAPAPTDIAEPPIQESRFVTIVNDLDRLIPTLTNLAGQTDPNATLTAGSPGTLFASLNPGACVNPAAKAHDWGPVTVTVRDPENGNLKLLDAVVLTRGTDLADAVGTHWFPVDLAARHTPGTHYLEFELRGPGSDPVFLLAPYTVEPVELTAVDAATAPESSSTREFAVQLDHPFDDHVWVEWQTVPGSADASDFTPRAGTAQIIQGETTATISVPVTDDATVEPNESFFVTIDEWDQVPLPDGIELVGTFGTAGITDDDEATLSIGDVSITEGTGPGATNATVTVTLSTLSAFDVSVDAAAQFGTADADDLAPTSATLTIPAGATTAVFDVAVTADAIDEGDESFDVLLTSPVGATIADDSATVTVLDDDTATITIDDVSVAEGSPATFTIDLATVADHEVTVHATTSPGTAGAGDFTATTVDLTIPAGAAGASISVPTTADDTDEDDESFTMMLSDAVGAPIGDGTGVATIVDDDVATVTTPVATTDPTNTTDPTDTTVPTVTTSPTVTTAPTATTVPTATTAPTVTTVPTDGDFLLGGDPSVEVVERNGSALVAVQLNHPAPAGGIAFDYATADGTATSPGDYTARSGVATIPAGATSVMLDIAIVDDATYESTESFSIVISNPHGPGVGDQGLFQSVPGPGVTVGAASVVTILDDDPVFELPTTGSAVARVLAAALVAIALGTLTVGAARRTRAT